MGRSSFCGRDIATAFDYKDLTNAINQYCKEGGV